MRTKTRRRGGAAAQAMRSYLSIKAQLKRLYERQDRALARALLAGRPGEPVELGDGRTACLVDLFDGKTVVFRSKAFRRWAVEEV